MLDKCKTIADERRLSVLKCLIAMFLPDRKYKNTAARE